MFNSNATLMARLDAWRSDDPHNQKTFELLWDCRVALIKANEEIEHWHSHYDAALFNWNETLDRTAQLQHALNEIRGTPEARFVRFMELLEERYPDPEPLSARGYELRFLAWLDNLLLSKPILPEPYNIQMFHAFVEAHGSPEHKACLALLIDATKA